MTPAARVQAAIEVLDEILSGTPAEKTLTNWARNARYAGSKDRAAVRDHVFQALRCRRSYASVGGGMTGRGLMIGALRSADQELESVFTGARHAPLPLSEDEGVSGRDPDTAAERLDLPDWLWERFVASLGPEGAQRAAQHLQRRGPVVLRVNLKMSDPVQAIEILKEDDVLAEPVPAVDSALIVTEGARRIAQSNAYRDGLVELQDTSSQVAMARLGIPAGAKVLDYCAGGGGKTLAMAARAEANWFAHDANPARMRDLPERAKRAGVTVRSLGTDELSNEAPFDLALCDVPCSGSGTWRRAPDAKWRFSQEDLEDLAKTQTAILRDAAALVRPGGQLVYATCSVLKEENEDQIDRFLSGASHWKLEYQERQAISEIGDGFFLSCLRSSV